MAGGKVMQAKVFSITATGTGNQSYTGLPFLPKAIIFFGSIISTNPTVQQRAFVGASDDAMVQRAMSAFGDSTGRESERSSSDTLIIPNRATNIDIQFKASMVSYDNNGGGVYGFTINQSVNSINPTIDGIALA